MLRPLAICAFSLAVCVALLAPSSSASPAPQTDLPFPTLDTPQPPPPPPAPPLPPASLNGTWKLNDAQSDNPDDKMKGSNQLDLSDGGGPVPQSIPSSGRRRDENAERAAKAGALGGPVSTAGNTRDLEKTLALLRPAMSLAVAVRENEFDLVDEQDHKRALFTDGRKLQKSKSESDQEIAAAWDNTAHLTYDGRGPRGEKITWSFQVSPKTNQLIETISVDNSRIFAPVMIRYVYDPAPSSASN
jgi:hypothetical protein